MTINKLVSTITFSKKRENLLLFLRDGPKTLEEIRNSLKVTSSGVIPQIRKLEEQNLVRQEGKKYYLTETGMVIAEVFGSFIKTIEIIDTYKDFWESHDIKAIPPHLLKRIYELGNCHMIERSTSDIYEPHKEFIDNLLKSKRIMGISPIFREAYPSFFLQLAVNGAEISLIVTRNVFDRIKKDYKDTLQKFLDLKTTQLYVHDEDTRLASVSTDVFCSTSLFFKNGGYDSQRELISSDYSALKWGEELFEHFQKDSKRVKSL